MAQFRPDNTEGYDAAALAKLNAEFDRRIPNIDDHEDDKSYLDHVAESVLIWFDHRAA